MWKFRSDSHARLLMQHKSTIISKTGMIWSANDLAITTHVCQYSHLEGGNGGRIEGKGRRSGGLAAFCLGRPSIERLPQRARRRGSFHQADGQSSSPSSRATRSKAAPPSQLCPPCSPCLRLLRRRVWTEVGISHRLPPHHQLKIDLNR